MKEKKCQLSCSKSGPCSCLRRRIWNELGTTLEGIWYDFGLRGSGVGKRMEIGVEKCLLHVGSPVFVLMLLPLIDFCRNTLKILWKSNHAADVRAAVPLCSTQIGTFIHNLFLFCFLISHSTEKAMNTNSKAGMINSMPFMPEMPIASANPPKAAPATHER